MMHRYKAICLDLDGTVYKGQEVIKDAQLFIRKLQKAGTEPYYITNNSSLTAEQFTAKLSAMGISTSPDRIMTSAIAAAKYCKEKYEGASVMMIGEEGLEAALKFEDIALTTTNPDIVVVGIDRSISYEKLSKVSLAIQGGARFIATNKDVALPTEDGLVPGNGSFVKLLETTTGIEALTVGKPESHMLHFIQEKGYRKDEMIMIGDNYDTDIQAGIRFGIDTIYVEGGVTSAEAVLTKQDQPTFKYKTLSDWHA